LSSLWKSSEFGEGSEEGGRDAGAALRGCIMREARVQRLRRELGMGWGMVW
jgi:hypothetical protein